MLVTWLKFQINFKQRHEKPSNLLERLHQIEHELHNHHHPINRQQYQENKHQLKTMADELQLIDRQLKEKHLQHVHLASPICITPLSATSSGYGSDLN